MFDSRCHLLGLPVFEKRVTQQLAEDVAEECQHNQKSHNVSFLFLETILFLLMIFIGHISERFFFGIEGAMGFHCN